MTEHEAGAKRTAQTIQHDEERPAMHLADSIRALDLPTELAQLRAEEPWQRSGRHSRTLIKDADLRVVLLALRAGARLEEHHAPGRITIHTLDGHLRVSVGGQVRDLAAGQLMTIGPAIQHAVEAVDESAFLLTIAWPV
jgi:quercetin dioxygenase-like cupin family protein